MKARLILILITQLHLQLIGCATIQSEPEPTDAQIEWELRAIECVKQQRRDGKTAIRFPLQGVVEFSGTDIFGDPISRKDFEKEYGGGSNAVK